MTAGREKTINQEESFQNLRRVRSGVGVKTTLGVGGQTKSITVRLRTKRTKGSGSAKSCLAMVFELAQSAQNGWRRLRGYAKLKEIVAGVEFVDGIKKAA